MSQGMNRCPACAAQEVMATLIPAHVTIICSDIELAGVLHALGKTTYSAEMLMSTGGSGTHIFLTKAYML